MDYCHIRSGDMIVKTRIFELCDGRYGNFSELARAMGISVSQLYRVRQGARHINQQFIVGAIMAFPEYRLDELFYLVSNTPAGNTADTAVYVVVETVVSQ